jgi:hypothetical protein
MLKCDCESLQILSCIALFMEAKGLLCLLGKVEKKDTKK